MAIMDEIRRLLHTVTFFAGLRLPLAALCLWAAVSVSAQDDAAQALEYRIKAAQIYWFATFIEWPDTVLPGSPGEIRLCVLGSEPYGEAMKTLEGKDVQGKKMRVVQAAGLERMPDCHILFVMKSQQANWAAIREKIGNRPILTVGDTDGFALSGGIINFVQSENKVRFQLNLQAARGAGLTVSSRLVRSALEIIGEPSSERKS